MYLVYLKDQDIPEKENFNFEDFDYYDVLSFKKVDDIKEDLIYRDCKSIYRKLYFIISEDKIEMKSKVGSYENTTVKLDKLIEIAENIYYDEVQEISVESMGGSTTTTISLYVNKKYKDFKCPAIIEDYVRVLYVESEKEAALSELSYDHDTYERYLYINENSSIIIKWAEKRFDQSTRYLKNNSLYDALLHIQDFDTNY